MLKDVKDKLSVAIGRKGLKYTVIFSNVSVEGLSGLFRFYSYSKDYIPYLNKTINEDEDISIDNFYIGARRKGIYIVYRDVTPTALRYR